MKNRKGGYIIIDLENNDLTSSFTLEGVYERLEGNYGKAIQLTGITINSVEKADIFVKAVISSDNYVINVYGYTLTIDDDDLVTPSEGETIEGDLNVEGALSTDGSLYCHPILLYTASSPNRIQFLLFNNKSDAYTDIDELQNDLLDMYEGTQLYIMLSGIYNGAQALYLGVSSSLILSFVDANQTSGTNVTTALTLSSLYTSISDGVNKIL